jgi:hypothetical protein
VPTDTFPADKGAHLSIWGTAEVATTIIAASIPVLRVFLRDVHTSVEKRYRRGRDSTTGGGATIDRRTRLRSGNSTVVAATPRGAERGREGPHTDDCSDRSILASGKIFQTHEINIETQSRSENGDAYEMGLMADGPTSHSDVAGR